MAQARSDLPWRGRSGVDFGEPLKQAAAAPEDQGLLCIDTCVHVVMALTGPLAV